MDRVDGIHLKDLDDLFSASGGTFYIPPSELQHKLANCKALLLDWDGVFNDGTKRDGSGSTFSEPDAMGTNIFRFGYWLKHRRLISVNILTGEANEPSFHLARREHFNGVYFKSIDKTKSLNHLLKETSLKPSEIAFVFDDVIDLAVAEVCGVRLQVRRTASPLFNRWIGLHNCADYVTGHEGGHFAVREVCELLLGLLGMYDEAVKGRMGFSIEYQQYLSERNAIQTRFYELTDGKIQEVVN